MSRPLAVAFGLSAGPVVALGFARFAYGLVLPAMRDDLQWSFGTAGQLNTANAVGYLAGALIAAPLARRTGESGAFLGGIAVTAVALLASAATSELPALLLLRALSGGTGAVCFVVGGALTSRAGLGRSDRFATLLLGIYFAGSGLGMVISGAVVPVVLAAWGWRAAWLVLGGLASAVLVVAVVAVRAARDGAPAPAGEGEKGPRRWPVRPVAALLLAYGLFGVGYIAYMTFVVAYLVQAGAGVGEVTAFWVVLGLAAVAGGFFWGAVLGGLRGGSGAALVLAVLAIGAGLPLVWHGAEAAFVSAVLFGLAFLNVMTAVSSAARRLLPPWQWTSAIAGLTVGFALGQGIGPVVAGFVSDGPGGIGAGLGVGFGLLVFAGLAALAQPREPASIEKGRGER
ncbi:YbfB/YjiJ family MFS transporter [Amycolatopsis sp. MtRt-6]|uniref:YbfB/YjiJ family MFS transporter n=1 Tax=Amycolatopsis sp. MtRt-6 TaxID=2792782 RepID=UPI001A8D98C8|nr:YbfB/YjiJ family MFS transporter [Amycolatopsis sp. MtRt-6]